ALEDRCFFLRWYRNPIAESLWGATAAKDRPRAPSLGWPRRLARGMGSRFLQVIRHADAEIVRPRWRLTSSQRDCTFRPQKRIASKNTVSMIQENRTDFSGKPASAECLG